MNEYLFMIIIVTNPKCQITQQSHVDNWRQVKGFLYLSSRQERQDDKNVKTTRTIVKLFQFRV